MTGAMDEESPIPECIICKETELESSEKLLTNIMCDCFYSYHRECMEDWLRHKEKKCLLCNEDIDFSMPATNLDLIRIELARRRVLEERRNKIYKFLIIFIALSLIFIMIYLIFHTLGERETRRGRNP
tara:strand:+ start:325 stop:708 length:384 start_codon:yes stop_codon:yes gene_type:complete